MALASHDKTLLLQLAREALEAAVQGKPAPAVDVLRLSPAVLRPGCCFVTLTTGGELRGCIGGLLPQQSLYEDVRERAAQAALKDYRFQPVTPAELGLIEIELSILTEPQPLNYTHPADLPQRLRPHIDGVILARGGRRATFLPQVWEKVPNPETFLSMLCEKMGVSPETWRQTKLEVQVYQVEKFAEGE